MTTPELFAGVRAALFDLDGVLTPTAAVHRVAWSRLFTEYFAKAGVAPYTESDYFEYIDGKPRYDGVRSALASRGLELPEGDPSDGPDAPTVCGLGNRKNLEFTRILSEEGVEPYPGSIEFLDAVDGSGIPSAVVSSSANAVDVLRAAGLLGRFAAVVDGKVAKEHALAGKPDPATFTYGAEQLGAPVDRAVVFEDATSGVAAGRAGGFIVVGVNRGTGRDALLQAGADVVVDDLGELVDDWRAAARKEHA
ncbi:HAD family hydrolase [Gryllotalpicola ginsengisoli]|uniref:HAD family hydrolase n=1 Tax=Gryllotalpicola ginsengisoli TaxID=444608 RepID=UPI0003B7295B|nr:HAD-IA family hydrolase [Gryllotalpicola ginsengisoli]